MTVQTRPYYQQSDPTFLRPEGKTIDEELLDSIIAACEPHPEIGWDQPLEADSAPVEFGKLYRDAMAEVDRNLTQPSLRAALRAKGWTDERVGRARTRCYTPPERE